MKSNYYKLIELFFIFIIIPVSYALPYVWQLKLLIGLLGFVYVIYILLKVEGNKFKIAHHLNWNRFCKTTILKFIVIAFLTFLYVWLIDRDSLFEVVINRPKMWIAILFVYSFLSVYPQELIYRTFFFQRYQMLFSNDKIFLFVNAVIFSLGHLFFRNVLVIVLTFLGGILFALTYHKTKSTLLVSIEHAVYGCWLFTVGMGDMLGFPS